ncbi:MAG: PilT/PilU family type 4a pilus ATPase [Candidatus Omnitrophica bacterium]|nr:PilT/PilU family type 4a pilus ATPase [Candidatus Omnitrophota bacterium]
MEIIDLLQVSEERKASDLILTVGVPPVLRIDKRIVQTNMEILSQEEVKRLIFSLLNKDQIEKFEKDRELNFAYSAPGIARFRSNLFYQRNSIAAALRRIPFEIASLEQLKLPVEPLKKLANLKSGLVIISGPVGSGKSTTLAAMVEYINTEKETHIITIEDPIEYLFRHKKSVIEQREIPSDTHSFPTALKNVMRQNPDVVLIGEMRDRETVETSISAAETGALVLATLHAPSASEVINRIIDFFPAQHQPQIRAQLSSTLAGVISQVLIPVPTQKGLVVACEVLLALPSVRTIIREGNTHQLQNVIETSSKYGMQSMDQVLLELHRQKLISNEDLIYHIHDRERDEIKQIIFDEIF